MQIAAPHIIRYFIIRGIIRESIRRTITANFLFANISSGIE